MVDAATLTINLPGHQGEHLNNINLHSTSIGTPKLVGSGGCSGGIKTDFHPASHHHGGGPLGTTSALHVSPGCHHGAPLMPTCGSELCSITTIPRARQWHSGLPISNNFDCPARQALIALRLLSIYCPLQVLQGLASPCGGLPVAACSLYSDGYAIPDVPPTTAPCQNFPCLFSGTGSVGEVGVEQFMHLPGSFHPSG